MACRLGRALYKTVNNQQPLNGRLLKIPPVAVSINVVMIIAYLHSKRLYKILHALEDGYVGHSMLSILRRALLSPNEYKGLLYDLAASLSTGFRIGSGVSGVVHALKMRSIWDDQNSSERGDSSPDAIVFIVTAIAIPLLEACVSQASFVNYLCGIVAGLVYMCTPTMSNGVIFCVQMVGKQARRWLSVFVNTTDGRYDSYDRWEDSWEYGSEENTRHSGSWEDKGLWMIGL